LLTEGFFAPLSSVYNQTAIIVSDAAKSQADRNVPIISVHQRVLNFQKMPWGIMHRPCEKIMENF
jgi:hypothetical protein